MPDKIGGGADKHPPDNTAENILVPQAGFIYKLNRKYAKGFDFIKVEAVIPAEKDPQGKARVELLRLNPRKGLGSKWEKFSPGLTLEKFLAKNNPNNYTFVADSEDRLYEQENIPADQRPARILNVRDLGEPVPPADQEAEVPESQDAGSEEGELLLEDEVVAEDEGDKDDTPEPAEDVPVAEELATLESESSGLEEKAEGVLIQADVRQIMNEYNQRIKDGEQLDGANPYEEVLRRNDIKQGDKVAFFSDNEEKIGVVMEQYGAVVIRDELGSIYFLTDIFNSDDGYIKKIETTEDEEKSVTPEPITITPEPTEPPTPEVPKELTPEQKKRSELGFRLGFTADQVKERETLERAVDEARADYVSNLYQHEQKLSRVLSILSLQKNPEPEEQYRHTYEERLKELQAFDGDALERYLTRSTTPEHRQSSLESYLERYNRLEAVALWSEQQRIRSVHQEAGVEQLGGFSKKVVEIVDALGAKYQDLSWKKKLLVGGGLVGAHTALALVSGPAAIGLASLWLGAKVVTGTVAYKKTSILAEQAAQWAGDKLANRKDTKEVNELAERFGKGEILGDVYFEKLNAVALKNISEVDKKLAAYEKRSFFAKAAALTFIFGVPASRFLGDILGAGAETVSAATDASPVGTETIEAVDTPVESPADGASVAGTAAKISTLPAEADIIAPPEPVPAPAPIAPEVLTKPPVLQPGEGHPDVIGFKDTPLSPEEKYWQGIRNGQGNFTDADEVEPEGYESNEGEYEDTSLGEETSIEYEDSSSLEQDGGGILDADSQPEVQSDVDSKLDSQSGHDLSSDPAPETESPEPQTETHSYSYEESRYQSLTEDQRPVWRESMTDLQKELLDIDHTEFGADYTPTNWQADQLWSLNKGNSMQDLIAFDNPRYNYDPRDYFQEEIGRRGIYLPPVNPEPRLGDGPDARGIYTMDQIKDEYRHNIAQMHRAAVEKFGSVAHPLGRRETVQAYMSRIATLYTRARLENPDFRLKF